MTPLLPLFAVVGLLALTKSNTGPPTVKGTSGFGAMSQQDMQMVQHDLTWLGYYVGPMHGRFDEATSRAVRSFQEEHGIAPADGLPGRATLEALEYAVASTS